MVILGKRGRLWIHLLRQQSEGYPLKHNNPRKKNSGFDLANRFNSHFIQAGDPGTQGFPYSARFVPPRNPTSIYHPTYSNAQISLIMNDLKQNRAPGFDDIAAQV